MELADFLRARLAEDEQAASRVKSSWRQIGETGVIVASDGGRAEECANGNWTGIAEHIVRHDPARVLAEVEAKRLVMQVHNARDSWGMCLGCPRDDKGSMYVDIEQCPILRALALPYADHPDYDASWKP